MTDGLQIIGLGIATLDILIRMEELPSWEQSSKVKDFRFDGGGLVGTAIVAAAKLGARVGYVGTAGSDEAAELKLRSFVENDVDLSHLVRRPGPENQMVAVFVHASTGERIFCGREDLHDHPLVAEDLDRAYMTSAPYLHIDPFHGPAALAAAKWVRAAGGTVVMDASATDEPVPPDRRELVRHVDVLISGRGFARHLTGLEDVYAAGEAILELGPRVFVETVGEEGCYTIARGERFHTPAFEVKVVDTTGAGDVFHGAYIVGLLHGWDLRQTAQFASAVAAIKCTQLGGRAGVPTFERTLAFLHERGIDLRQPLGYGEV